VKVDLPLLPTIAHPDPKSGDAAAQFDVYLARQLVGALRDTVPEGVFGDLLGPFGDMMEEELAGKLARGGLGLADRLMPDLGERHAPARAPRSDSPFASPLDGRLSSSFGSRRDPFEGDQRHHNGVDIAAPLGTPVGSIGEGTVIEVGRSAGAGNFVRVRHSDGFESRYNHLQSSSVNPGQTINQGQRLGTVGSTGRSTGPHLHLELQQDGARLDPSDWIPTGD
jgi:murein DD-endopeptidase MepM/ murein hydrolase activator NlpD